MLLLAIGLLLLVESSLSFPWCAPTPPPVVRIASALIAGVTIGIVSSLLGVAGGELIIPTLVFGYGVDVKIAGTLSLLVSLPTILVGLWRHAALGNTPRREDITGLVVPMGAGSIAGALIGGLLVAVVPSRAVKALLGAVLIASALRAFRAR